MAIRIRKFLVASSSLLTLLDDIATLLDDVAVLSKVAAKKTSGVLGDDLALNAQQVSGVQTERELPVIWSVAKGSLLNKIILVPSALLISAIAPWSIPYLLIIGGLFLCYEGVEKITHKLTKEEQEGRQKRLAAVADKTIDIKKLEREKIKGAIRTDFILSAEIIVIILGTVSSSPLTTQIAVLTFLALGFTVGVYGLVACIVKLDDFGLYLLRKSLSGGFNALQRTIGRGILIFAPWFMKALSIVGTIAMFLVGGGIIVHGIEYLHHLVDGSHVAIAMLANLVVGIVAGAIVLMIVATGTKAFRKAIA
ncbi:MAG: DUF808 domain-containing protein [Pseudomonadota bacterium]